MSGSPTATSLPDGRILVAGGTDSGGPLDNVEVYDPVKKAWQPVRQLTAPRNEPLGASFTDGSVLVIGGVGAGGIPLGAAELFKLFDKGTPCDQATDCQSGSCVDGVCCNAVCTSPCNACSVRQDLFTGLLAGSPIPGTCEPVNGVMCNDGDACTRTDVCQGGSCVGNDPVTCAVPDSCTEAVCDKATEVCSKPTNKPDTLACDDGNPCTTQDTCQEALAASATPPPAERRAIAVPATTVHSMRHLNWSVADSSTGGMASRTRASSRIACSSSA